MPHEKRTEENISIHAPRAGSDQIYFSLPLRKLNFNPRSPCGERLFCILFVLCIISFQSTLPVRGATAKKYARGQQHIISIHAPRAGSDSKAAGVIAVPGIFQSTLPVRGATFF